MASILIVEDDLATAGEIKKRLSAAGHDCTIKPSGTEALDVARDVAPDVIVLDIMLPGTSGFEVCRRIRRDPELYMVPILIVSAMNDEEEVFHGLAQGADDYVAKPFEVTNLVQRVEALLRSETGRQAPDEITALPGADGTRREIQRRSSMQDTFAVAHCELMNLREFTKQYGAEARNRAIRHLARALVRCGEELAGEQFFVGHMGGGHFVVLASPDSIRSLCEWVSKVWAGHVDKLYRQVGAPVQEADAQPGGRPDEVAVLFCVTLREAKDTTTPQQVFEILSQIRNKAVASHQGGIHLDRRALRGRSTGPRKARRRDDPQDT